MSAHSIKNPKIIHFVQDNHYVCIGACSITPSKSTNMSLKATCKNCKRWIIKYLMERCLKEYKRIDKNGK
jgi:hypothetical protein